MSTTWDPRTTPWHIDESEFYEIEDPRAQREFLLRYAVLAPSGHNTQPWSFRITDDGIEVYADYRRRLPVADPDDRELLISIGAAIANLRVAAAHFGFESTVLYQPLPDDALPLALIALRETCNPDPELRRLFPAITNRQTNRTTFEEREIEPEVLERLCDLVESSEHINCVLPQERTRIAELVEEASRALMADERWRSELAEWVRPNESGAVDGMSGDAFGIPGPLSAFAPWLVRSFDLGEVRAEQERRAIEKASGLIAITGDDSRIALVRTGEELERLLLTLTSCGVQYAFANAPCQVPATRRELGELIRSAQPPQLLVRIGYAKRISRRMPRRPVGAVTG